MPAALPALHGWHPVRDERGITRRAQHRRRATRLGALPRPGYLGRLRQLLRRRVPGRRRVFQPVAAGPVRDVVIDEFQCRRHRGCGPA